MTVSCRRVGDIGVIAIANPPVNTLRIANGTVAALHKALTTYAADPGVAGIVLAGEGKGFSGGADIADFAEDPSAVAPIRDLLNGVEALDKPVVAALHGFAVGGGLELALAAHCRVAAKDTRLAFPEIRLGLLPGAGGTQRLPRLVGVARALAMISTGATMSAAEGLASGLLDEVVEDRLIETAVAAARRLARDGFSRTCDIPLDDAGASAPIETARRDAHEAKAIRRARMAVVDCIEAAIREPFEAALDFEARQFGTLMLSEESRGLRHAFSAERLAASLPGIPKSAAARTFRTAGIVGAGTMGTGIALALANADIPVILVDPKAEAQARALRQIRSTVERDAARGRITEAQAAKRIGLIETTGEFEDVRDCDLVIEAVFEDAALKRQVFRDLDAIVKPETVLASNTSTLDVNAIAAATTRPERVVGMHFFSPANVMRLVEVIRADRTAPEVLLSALAFAKAIGKVGVVSGVCDGFIGNRIFEEYLRQAYFLLDEGALPRQIDAALEGWGMAMGPLRVMDLAGQDIGWSIRKRRAVEQPDRPYSAIPDLLCEAGRFGQKTGAGYYRYPDGRTAEVDPEVDALVSSHSRSIGLDRREIGDREIVERCVLAMINEGARIVEEGIAGRASDIDVVYVNGYGFPAERGGPMFHADRLGLPRVLGSLRGYAGGYQGWALAPAPLIVDLAASRSSFGSLDDISSAR